MDASNAAATTVMTGAGLTPAAQSAVQDLAGEGAKDLQAIILGGEEFLTGQPVDVKIGIPTGQITFVAKNPFGVVYDFTLSEKNGNVDLKGVPQS